MLRAEAESGSERGKIIKRRIDNGELVPVEIAAETIIEAIRNAPTPVVLIDGYPRSVEQMEVLDRFLAQTPSIALRNVIEVVVSETIARERVLGRARGADDSEAVFKRRMQVYTEPLFDIQRFYEQKGLLHKIDGERSVAEVVEEMKAFILERIQQN
jgi:adenylate kinase